MTNVVFGYLNAPAPNGLAVQVDSANNCAVIMPDGTENNAFSDRQRLVAPSLADLTNVVLGATYWPSVVQAAREGLIASLPNSIPAGTCIRVSTAEATALRCLRAVVMGS